MKAIKQNKIVFLIFLLFSLLILHSSFLIMKVNAQSAISLSVSPPLFEIMIQPNKDVKQIFTITNLGGDSIITPKIVYFTPNGDFGNIDLTEDLAPDWIIYNKDAFTLKNQAKFDFEVTFSPAKDTEETDHFLTLVFETNEPSDLLGQSSVVYKSKIGANILLTVSKDGNPKRLAEIVEFSAPKLVDSLVSSIMYHVSIKNSGNSYWKPNGKIIVNDETLNLAPLNILSGTSRNINCIDNENLIDCKLKNKLKVGKITSKLEFTIDNEPKVYSATASTYFLPLTLIIAIMIILLIWRKIRR